MKKKLKIIVTGGAGFIGSHIVDEYVKAGHHVAVIDNLSTGAKKNVNAKAVFYAADICDAKKIREILALERPDIINHQAAAVSVSQSTLDPLSTYKTNTLGTITLLVEGLPYIKKFIFASTGGAMYAKPKKFPATELELPTPMSPYGFSKQLAEEAVRFYCAAESINYTILRYANVFGPRQNPHGESGVMAIFSDLAVKNKKPTIYRKETTRDYVYVGDIAVANRLALEKGDGETINIGTGKEVTNQKVYDVIAREFNWKQKPDYKPARPGELLRSALANAKAKKVLGWSPTVSLEEGVKNIHVYQN